MMTPRTALLLAALAGCNGTDLALEFDGRRVDADDPEAGAFPGLVALPNLDDDDGDDDRDAESGEMAADEDDLSTVVVPSDVFESRAADRLELVLEGRHVRVWHDGKLVLSDDGAVWEVPDDGGDLVLDVEALRPLARADLVLRDTKGKDPAEVRLAVTGAPVLLNHHLQAAEITWVMGTSDAGFSNASMIAEMRAVLGDRLQTIEARRYRYDVWVQDEPEMATLTAPDRRMDFVLDSVRDRGLDAWPETLREPGVTSDTWGEGFASSYDSFGNLEVTPPVEGYPFGRAYYGAVGSQGPKDGLREELAAQLVQAPFTLDTTWLCVGHVDEFTSFVPDPTAPRGFRFLVSDTTVGYALIDSLDPDHALPRYGADFGYPTAGDLADDTSLRSYNLGLQSTEIEPNIERMRDAIGLTDDEIVRIPALFERVGGCGAAALVPGSVNLLVADVDGQTHVFIPDPFFRASDDDADDPFIGAIVERLPDTLQAHFVDDWDVYHLGLGEVHCGINTRRTPYGAWWEEALDTLEEAR